MHSVHIRFTPGSHPAHIHHQPASIRQVLNGLARKVPYANDEHKKARQGVVGLCRASDVHHKREKKQTPGEYSLESARRTLYPTAHKARFIVKSI
jgi:hypothetical protein